jgi:hypothetical protein
MTPAGASPLPAPRQIAYVIGHRSPIHLLDFRSAAMVHDIEALPARL